MWRRYHRPRTRSRFLEQYTWRPTVGMRAPSHCRCGCRTRTTPRAQLGDSDCISTPPLSRDIKPHHGAASMHTRPSPQASGKVQLSYARGAYGVKKKMTPSAWKSRMYNGLSAVCSSRTGVLCPRRWPFDHSHCQCSCSLLMCVVSSHCVRPSRNRGHLTSPSRHLRVFLDLPPSRGW